MRSSENGDLHPSVLKAMRKLRDGYINETRVRYGRYEEFISTACIVNLSFLGCGERGHPEKMLPQIERWEGSYLLKHPRVRFSIVLYGVEVSE